MLFRISIQKKEERDILVFGDILVYEGREGNNVMWLVHAISFCLRKPRRLFPSPLCAFLKWNSSENSQDNKLSLKEEKSASFYSTEKKQNCSLEIGSQTSPLLNIKRSFHAQISQILV